MARNRKHRVDEAENGRDAVDKVRTAMFIEHEPYDCIVMDYEMPILKGPDAVMEIRQLLQQQQQVDDEEEAGDGNNKAGVCIIGVTGNVLQEDVHYFLSCGADRVLGKPVKFQHLEEIWAAHHFANSSNQ
jgi:CheY-like chemotaxis protein